MTVPAGEAVASPLRVRDLVPDFLAYARRAAHVPRQRWAELWRTHYLAPHRDLYATLDRQGDWSGVDDLEGVLERLHGREAVFAARAERLAALLPATVAGVGRAMRRCGYLVGLELARLLRERHPLHEIAAWDLDRGLDEVRRGLHVLRAAT
ncbi:hypothetical protein [Micromonospora sp. DT62]|uniref:hypothetical protein n=1 Tax=Micromonospora sp. DT62 TaxID=3416521 RepID=UPI003CE93D08